MEWFTNADYWLSRLVFQRGLAVLYGVAFVSSALQFKALIGERGLLPVPRFVASVPFRRAPSIFQWHYSDPFFAVVAWTGAALSAAVAAGAADLVPLWAAMPMWFTLWALYLSIVNVGQTWYAFMWEMLLLEAGFLAIFLGNDEVAPPVLVLGLLIWLLFRLEFGAGLIKLRGDRCWRDLTCLYYHHETQPMPGPLSWFFHHLPRPVHRAEVAANHLAQLGAPLALFAPQPVAGWAAAFIVVTQLWLVASGNFAWLNWLAILLAVSAIDDVRAAHLLPLPKQPPAFGATPAWYAGLVLAVTALVAVLSYWPVRNLFSRRQRMNVSFNPLHLVNTYGAFGSVSRVRYEVVIEGTDEADLTDETQWKEYEFKGKPGDRRRLPPQVAPYHLRLDWLMWFAALSPAYAAEWFVALLVRLLDNDAATLRLLRRNPFPSARPTFLRARLYAYRFTTWPELRRTGTWWHRTLVQDYLPPVTSAETTEPRSPATSRMPH
ncbi:lipase maturation factor family protein [Streptomyces camelliae]|uniref:Lipase maturation factor family protein n=1 Tax=Streptomyces camelliae TaxID=3004093 RepID=A0ABY7PF43_9ACTN|nr:lipase maturation factor family protein [Streptomyces sp. HUAS 2-6]WBO69260.1 lipase maturation factor family protein [Streptomyces sp. HUAS 2-6]